MKPAKTVPVKFGVDMDRLRKIITSDISIDECIFDLIDNSIDAARDSMLADKHLARDLFGLPKSYKGHRIQIHIGSKYIAISDNGSGMTAGVLKAESFFTGKSSVHPFGLGHYGIGLLRAALKLGRSFSLETDNGESAYRLDVTERELRKISNNTRFIATEIKSVRRKKNTIIFRTPNIDYTRSLLASEGQSQLIAEVSTRYGIFLNKGIRICINGRRCRSQFPGISKKKGLFSRRGKKTLSNGVDVHVEVGYHEEYRIDEPNTPTKSKIIQQCGWYVVCNDRVIRVADKDNYVKWHPEYNGMVFWARFVSRDPSLMPWDSKKANLNKTSKSFLETEEWFHDLSKVFRGVNRSARKPTGKTEKTGRNGKPNSKRSETSHDDDHAAHNENWDHLLPQACPQPADSKLKALMSEAKEFPITEFPYSAIFLFRSIVERSIFLFLYHTEQLPALQAHISSHRSTGPDRRTSPKPSLSDSIAWMVNHTDVFPADSRKDCKHACQHLQRDLKEINGIVHEGKLWNSAMVRNVRDRAYPLLETILRILSNP